MILFRLDPSVNLPFFSCESWLNGQHVHSLESWSRRSDQPGGVYYVVSRDYLIQVT